MTSIRNRIKKLRKNKNEKDIPIIMKDKSSTTKQNDPEITSQSKCSQEAQDNDKEIPNYAKKTLIDEAHFNHIQLLTYVNTFVVMVCFIMISIQFFSKKPIQSKTDLSPSQKSFAASSLKETVENKTLTASSTSADKEKNMNLSPTIKIRDPEADDNPSLSIALPSRDIPNNKKTKKKQMLGPTITNKAITNLQTKEESNTPYNSYNSNVKDSLNRKSEELPTTALHNYFKQLNKKQSDSPSHRFITRDFTFHFSDHIYKSGKYQITERIETVLEEIANLVKPFEKDLTLTVIGHSETQEKEVSSHHDEPPSLSLLRAQGAIEILNLLDLRDCSAIAVGAENKIRNARSISIRFERNMNPSTNTDDQSHKRLLDKDEKQVSSDKLSIDKFEDTLNEIDRFLKTKELGYIDRSSSTSAVLHFKNNYFNTGEFKLSSKERKDINQLYKIINILSSDIKLEVIGHTDARKIKTKALKKAVANNLLLSKLRAQTIAQAMIKSGFKTENIETRGKGPSERDTRSVSIHMQIKTI